MAIKWLFVLLFMAHALMGYVCGWYFQTSIILLNSLPHLKVGSVFASFKQCIIWLIRPDDC